MKNINKYVSKAVRGLRGRQRDRSVDPERFLAERMRRVQGRVEGAVDRNLPVIKGPSGGLSFARFALLAAAMLLAGAAPAQAKLTVVETFGCGRPIGKYVAKGLVHEIAPGRVKFIDSATNREVVLVGDVRVYSPK